MRIKLDKDLAKEYWWLFIGPLVFVLMGILTIILTYTEKPIEYTSLQTKVVTVETFEHHYSPGGLYTGPSSSYDYIQTSDGERYVISGEYQRKQLEELLTKGTKVTIMWHRNRPFWTLLAEEIYIDGIRVVAYDSNDVVNKTVGWIVGICGILLGWGSFCCVKFMLDNLNRKTKKRVKSKRKYRKVKKRK